VSRLSQGAIAALFLIGSAMAASCDDPADGTAGSAAGGNGGTSTSEASSSSGISNACADATITPERVPLTMYIMFDKSGSMLYDQKWSGAVTALIAFFQDADSAGLNVALRFFPDDQPVAGCNEIACDANACAAPLVDVGELNDQPAYADPHQKALVDAVNSRSPGGETPMYPALAGATQWTVAQADPANKRSVVILVTDGEPNGCNEDPSAIAALAGDAYAQAEVLTYAIGMPGSNLAQLDQIAQLGGTGQAFVVASGVNTDLQKALEKIRTVELACTFPVPTSEQVGKEVEPGEVNVTYASGGGDPQTIPQVANAGACGADGGWYYDNASAPTEITLCPATCDVVKNDPDAALEIVLGCKTVVK